MPKRKEPELDPKEQWKRFKEAAKKADLNPNDAEKAFQKLTPSESPTDPSHNPSHVEPEEG